MSRRRGRSHRSGLRRWPRWAEVAVCAAGAVGFLVAGTWQAYDIAVLASRGVVVQAEVLEEHGGRESYIRVEFTTAAGERVRGDTSNYKDLRGSALVDVVYDPRNPSRLQAADWGYDYVLPGILLAAGAVFSWLTIHTRRSGFPDWLRRDWKLFDRR